MSEIVECENSYGDKFLIKPYITPKMLRHLLTFRENYENENTRDTLKKNQKQCIPLSNITNTGNFKK